MSIDGATVSAILRPCGGGGVQSRVPETPASFSASGEMLAFGTIRALPVHDDEGEAMRAILMGAAVAVVSAGVAMADESVIASRFGNTTIATTASGQTVKLYYNADHTFTTKSGTQIVGGTWKLDGSNVCLTYSSGTPLPPGMTNPACVPITAHAVGDTWTVGEGTQKRTVTLVQGIQ